MRDSDPSQRCRSVLFLACVMSPRCGHCRVCSILVAGSTSRPTVASGFFVGPGVASVTFLYLVFPPSWVVGFSGVSWVCGGCSSANRESSARGCARSREGHFDCTAPITLDGRAHIACFNYVDNVWRREAGRMVTLSRDRYASTSFPISRLDSASRGLASIIDR